jgi:hypothetical protein
MKNMTSNLASIVLQYKYKCIYTYIAVCIAGELYVGNLLEFEFQILHSKLSNFGHYLKLTNVFFISLTKIMQKVVI